MDNVLDYIISNYVWFLVGLVVISMIIIGYVADTTDFWHKKKDKHKKENDHDDVDNTNSIDQAIDSLKNKKLSDTIFHNATDASNLKEATGVLLQEDLNVPLETSNNNNDENISKVLDITNEDLYAPLTNNNNSVNALNVNSTNLNAQNQEKTFNNLNDNNVSSNVSEIKIDNETTSVPEMELDNVSSNVPEIKVNNNSSFESTVRGKNSDNQSFYEKNAISDNDLLNDVIVDGKKEVNKTENTSKDYLSVGTYNGPLNEFKYDEKIVPEYITDTVKKETEEKIESEDDIWKF